MLAKRFSNINFIQKIKFSKSWNTFSLPREGEIHFFCSPFNELSTWRLSTFKNISILLALIPLLRKHTLDIVLFILKERLCQVIDMIQNIMLTIEIFQCPRKADRFYGHITLSDISACSIYFLTYLGWKPSCPNYLQHWSWISFLFNNIFFRYTW